MRIECDGEEELEVGLLERKRWGQRSFNGNGERSLRVWILILGRREGQSRAKGSLSSAGLNIRRLPYVNGRCY
jgi:hypothetical protein